MHIHLTLHMHADVTLTPIIQLLGIKHAHARVTTCVIHLWATEKTTTACRRLIINTYQELALLLLYTEKQ